MATRLINELRPDVNNPRKYKDDEAIKELALNIKKIGLINPIEILSNGTIVTGESRWRAAQLAGLETVPVSVIDVQDAHSKLTRQLSENMFRSDMSPIDLGRTFRKMADEQKCSLSQLAKEIGKSEAYVQEHVRLLNAPNRLKELLNDKKVDYRTISKVLAVPEEMRNIMIEGVEKKAITSHKIAGEVGIFLKAGGDIEVLKRAYKKGLKGIDLIDALKKTEPNIAKQIQKNLSGGQKLIAKMGELSLLLQKVGVRDIAPLHYGRLAVTMTLLNNQMKTYTLSVRALRKKQKREAKRLK